MTKLYGTVQVAVTMETSEGETMAMEMDELEGNAPCPGAEAAPVLRGDQRRARILDVARDLFFEQGFGATSMSMIAARVGGSKATLYAHFKSKEDLLIALVADQCARIEARIGIAPREGVDIRVALTETVRGLLTELMSETLVRMFQMVSAEARFNPALAEAFYDAGPGRGHQMMATYFIRAVQAGRLRASDPVLASHHFVALCRGELFFRRLLNLESEPDAARIEAEAEAVVDAFLTLYPRGPSV